MKYCMDCGSLLEERSHGKEGVLPYCPGCGKFCYPVYNTAVSMMVIDPDTQKVLLIQQYGRPFYILVAGYINRGEAAEDAVRREVMEETGLTVDRVSFNRSQFFEPSNTLMINFTCTVSNAASLHTNEEIDSWRWFSFDEARKNIKPGSLAAYFLNTWLDSCN